MLGVGFLFILFPFLFAFPFILFFLQAIVPLDGSGLSTRLSLVDLEDSLDELLDRVKGSLRNDLFMNAARAQNRLNAINRHAEQMPSNELSKV